MGSYYQYIEDYLSPEYPVDETVIIDQTIRPLSLAYPKDENYFIDQNISALPAKKQEDLSQSQRRNPRPVKFENTPNRKYDYCNSQTSYKLLDGDDLANFEADIRRGEMSREQLCYKYGVSRSTTSRFIRNYKEFGFLKSRKPKTSRPSQPDTISDLIGKLLADNPDMTYRDLRRRITELPKTSGYMKLQKEFFATFPK